MSRRPPTTCKGCGASAPVVVTGSPRDRTVLAVVAATKAGWGYTKGWYCQKCVQKMSPEQRAKVKRGPNEDENLKKRRITYRHIDPAKPSGLRRLSVAEASAGIPKPKELEAEQRRSEARKQIEELRRADERIPRDGGGADTAQDQL